MEEHWIVKLVKDENNTLSWKGNQDANPEPIIVIGMLEVLKARMLEMMEVKKPSLVLPPAGFRHN